MEAIQEELDLSAGDVSTLHETELREQGNAFDFLEELYTMTADDRLRSADALAGMILHKFTDSTTGKLESAFVETVLIDGSIDVLEAIEGVHAQALLVTAGGSVLQTVKARVLQEMVRQEAGQRVIADINDYVVVPNSKQYKTSLMAECFDSEGVFDIERLLEHGSCYGNIDGDRYSNIREVLVIDDKPENTQYASDNVHGLLVYPDGEADKRERNSLHTVAAKLYQLAA